VLQIRRRRPGSKIGPRSGVPPPYTGIVLDGVMEKKTQDTTARKDQGRTG